MEPFENELLRLLERREPPAGFTSRVMGRVRAERPVRKRWLRGWTLTSAIAAAITLGVFLDWRNDRREAERAEAELIMALQVAGEKIDRARDAVLRNGGEEAQ